VSGSTGPAPVDRYLVVQGWCGELKRLAPIP